MGEINYDFFEKRGKSVRFGIGIGVRNKNHRETGQEYSERYRAFAALTGAKFYLTSEKSRGLYCGVLLQAGYMKTTFDYTASGRNPTTKGNIFLKIGPIAGCTLLLNEHLFIEPEIGYLIGGLSEIQIGTKKSKSLLLKNRLHLAFNTGFRF